MNKQPTSASVIGAGIIGSWTALHLAEAGVQTTLIEQFPMPHTRGSSHGLSRAFRFLGELEMDRLDYSLDRWLELEQMTSERLFVKTGLLNFGPPGDTDLENYMNVLRDAQRPVEWLDNEAIAKRYPMLSYPGGWGAAWDPDGGLLIAHSCLGAVQARFLALGGQIVTGRVENIEASDTSRVHLEIYSNMSGESETLSFDSAVVCAGPWTARLTPQLDGLLRSLLTPVTYWHDPSGSFSAAAGCPIIFNARLTGIYGLPSCEYPGLVKMLFHGGPESDPDIRDMASFEPYIEKVSNYVKKHLPRLDHSKPAILESCMYTMTDDGFPIIDRLNDKLVLGCGFSGSGFKHSPATGLMLAALAMGRDQMISEGFRADRYLLGRFGSV